MWLIFIKPPRGALAAAILALVLAGPACSKAIVKTRAPNGTFQAEVVRVTDGDTIVVRTADFAGLKTRLYGIDAPESDQPGGREAKAALEPLRGRVVKVLKMDTDRHRRLVALIEEQDGKSVNLDLAARGHAWHYARYCRAQPICGRIKSAAAEARRRGLGLWQSPNPVPPWVWRQR
jgi:endonuclease YncB( thermonuclease family)